MTLLYYNDSEDTQWLWRLRTPVLGGFWLEFNIVRTLIFLSLGVYAVLRGEVFPGCIVLVGIVYFWRVPIERTLRLLRKERPTPSKRIRLEVGEEGMREICAGVENFAPWTTVISWQIWEERLFIRLKSEGVSDSWAIVPRHALEPDSASLDELIVSLKRHGIREADKK